MNLDTIAAIATALTNSGLGIIRVSGSDAIDVVNKLYRSKNKNKLLKDMKSHTIHYGFIYGVNDELIDEVMVSVMIAPNSFTMENVVEVNCHGGILVMNRILEQILLCGARLAEPGEFTKRAFLNGRIDLSEAEAVMDIISSKNEFALKSSVNQLTGSVSNIIKRLRNDILYEIAFIESALDDPEHISLEGYPDNLRIKTDNLLLEVDKLLISADNGKIRKEGIYTVIVGKPNAGKSSLLNLLAKEEKAIVTEIPGTTRDILEENIKLHGISFNIIDTAGIHSTEDVVEKIGVEKAIKYAAMADLIIYMADSSVPFDENDRKIIELINNKKCIILLNKADLKSEASEQDFNEFFNKDTIIIKTSTIQNKGIDMFEEAVKNMFFDGKIDFNDEVLITNMRHKEALKEAYSSLLMVKQSIDNEMPEDFYSIDLMSAYASLGLITGEEVEEDLINEIFSKFCMGK